MMILGRQILQSAFSAFLHFFLFLSSSICYWLFPRHGESAAIESGWWWNWVLFDPICEPTSEVREEACKWHLVPQGCWFSAWCIAPASLTYRLLQGTDLCGAFVESAKQQGCLWFGVGKGFYVIALDYFDWFFFSPSLPRKMQWM